MIIQGR